MYVCPLEHRLSAAINSPLTKQMPEKSVWAWLAKLLTRAVQGNPVLCSVSGNHALKFCSDPSIAELLCMTAVNLCAD